MENNVINAILKINPTAEVSVAKVKSDNPKN